MVLGMDSEEDDNLNDTEFFPYDDDNGSVDSDRQKNYIILVEKDIRSRQDEDTTTLSAFLSISKAAASVILRHYHWSVSNAQEAWFDNETRVRTTTGLLEPPTHKFSSSSTSGSKAKRLKCGICFKKFHPLDTISTRYCVHGFCKTCWRCYMSASINSDSGCLRLRCPDPSCAAAIDQDLIDIMASENDKDRYDRYLLRSYIEDNKNTKWCPAPGCEYAIEFIRGVGGGEDYDVTCRCSHGFCWNCMEEAHRPVGCDTVAKWITKNNAESGNTNWLLAYTKPCPNCKRPIEKTHGCMHMTCSSPCYFEFCWLCLGQWTERHSCNYYQRTGDRTESRRVKFRWLCLVSWTEHQRTGDWTESRREMEKKLIKRYTHYYERWAANESSRRRAVAYLKKNEAQLEELGVKQDKPVTELEFIVEAWLQIVECRRVLKWSYVYGYYLMEDDVAKRQFFEYLQGQAERVLEKLHRCAETDLQVFFNAESKGKGKETKEEAQAPTPGNDFNIFKTKLVGQTEVGRNYFEKLVRALENGLSEVWVVKEGTGTTTSTTTRTRG